MSWRLLQSRDQCPGPTSPTQVQSVLHISSSLSFSPTIFPAGQQLDTAERGEELEMWAIAVSPPAMFEEEERKVEVAHTASQDTCQHCNGVAQCQCWKCRVS